MKHLKNTLLILCLLAGWCGAAAQDVTTSVPIPIQWTEKPAGDFSFTKKWAYPQGVERMANGRPGCADGGFCPERCYGMLDNNGRIMKDSLTAFYSVLDTTHQPYTIQCTAWCYEWAGTHFIEAAINSAGDILCATATNEATHCSLQLRISGDSCYAQIELNSVAQPGSKYYYCSGGAIRADKKLLQSGILKADFSFNFAHPENPAKRMFWKGRIYKPLKHS